MKLCMLFVFSVMVMRSSGDQLFQIIMLMLSFSQCLQSKVFSAEKYIGKVRKGRETEGGKRKGKRKKEETERKVGEQTDINGYIQSNRNGQTNRSTDKLTDRH